eukprot:CAMPEP_0201906394 /NCGR_PEP_ID=MMETSP0902-20130614/57000_1 /ASSEMBLY_ACC=CAM_ASM_000551 /TAXON_ID=420261 /ORGANISM="Thalassiosira antarctica, Strain CCMP982" /LENGTH=30 /DNA_ID= /DNA_START= /DNA_END= /DNA_ORIENTATION=
MEYISEEWELVTDSTDETGDNEPSSSLSVP